MCPRERMKVEMNYCSFKCPLSRSISLLCVFFAEATEIIGFLGKLVLSRAEIIAIWNNNERQTDAVLNWILQKFNRSLNENKIKGIKIEIRRLFSYVQKYLPKFGRRLDKFMEAHSKWVSGNIKINVEKNDFAVPSSNIMGRPRLTYAEGGKRLKRKLAAELALQQDHNTPLLIHAAALSSKKAKDADVSYVLNKTLTEPENSNEIRKKQLLQEPVTITPDEGLAFLLENGLTKRQYCNMRLQNKNHHCDIYPSYKKLLEAKQKCRPNEIVISERIVQVSMQNLLNHTAERLIIMQHEVFNKFHDIRHVKLIASYGFDGSTGQSMYKQKFETVRSDCVDQSLFVTSLIPLKLIDNLDRVLWFNRTPQSIRFCRPLKIEYAKESTDHILSEKRNLDLQIQNLMPFVYTGHNSSNIYVTFDLQMTLIDGKILNAVTGTKSSQCCPICGAKPEQFRKIKNMKSNIFKPKPGTLIFGVSPLHAWIRFLEFVLKVSYRIGIFKWHIRQKNDKDKMKVRKYEIQSKLWDQLGLHIDKPRQNGSGSTNDGNTARRAFSNVEIFASILEFDVDILKYFHTILITISCEYEVNVDKFQNYCERAACLYMEKYPWYPMSATVHKILAHSSQIIVASVLPVGCLGENASEARNKFYKQDRRSHARQNSRVNNITDVFHRAMDSSDPLLSSLCISNRQSQNKRNALPTEVIDLLELPTMESTSNNNLYWEDDDSGSDTDVFESENLYSIELDVQDDC